MEAFMDIRSVSDGSSQVANLTRLAVAAQAARKPQHDSSLDVEAIELKNEKDIETGRIDTYA
jgi:hypothetical protein